MAALRCASTRAVASMLRPAHAGALRGAKNALATARPFTGSRVRRRELSLVEELREIRVTDGKPVMARREPPSVVFPAFGASAGAAAASPLVTFAPSIGVGAACVGQRPTVSTR